MVAADLLELLRGDLEVQVGKETPHLVDIWDVTGIRGCVLLEKFKHGKRSICISQRRSLTMPQHGSHHSKSCWSSATVNSNQDDAAVVH